MERIHTLHERLNRVMHRWFWGVVLLLGLTACAASPLESTPTTESARATFLFFYTDN
jgi:hypothetical protein